MDRKQIKELAAAHRSRFETDEAQLFRKSANFYNGRFGSIATHPNSLARNMHADRQPPTINLAFAVIESVLNALSPATQAVYARGLSEEGEAIQESVAHVINTELRRNEFVSVCRLTLLDAALRRRGIFKTVLQPDPENPGKYAGVSIRDVQPATLFYDRDARMVQDVSYWGQHVQMPWRVFRQRVESGVYARPKVDVRREGQAAWLGLGPDHDRLSSSNATAEVFGYANVWEVYDLFDGKVYHWHEASDTLLLEGEIASHPFAMFSPNHNGENLDGISEVELILPQQEQINDIRRLFSQVAYRMVPRVLFDSGVVDQQELEKALKDGAGTFRGVRRLPTAQGKTFQDAFYALPMAQIPDGLIQIAQMMEADTQVASGMLMQQRGMAQNVRTAQEMAVMAASSRDRLNTRTASFNAAISQVAKRTLRLMIDHVEGPFSVKDRERWTQVTNTDLRRFDGVLELTPFSPISSNPQALAEALSGMANWLTQNPEIDQRALTEMVMTGLGVPLTRALVPREESLRKQEAMIAQAGGAPPGAAMMSPDAMEQAAAQQDAAAQVDPTLGT